MRRSRFCSLALFCSICLILSVDSHAQWIQTNGPEGGTVTALAEGDAYVFAGTGGAGIFRSSDQGSHWATANTGLGNLFISFLAMRGTTLLAGSDNIYRSTDNGTTWAAQDPSVGFAYFIARNDSMIMASTDLGIIRSSDNGISWTVVDILYDGTVGLPLSMSGTVVYACYDQDIYRSTDYGTTWTKIDSSLTVGTRAFLVNGSTMFVGNALNQLWRFKDSSWVLMDSSNTINSIINCFIVSGSNLFAGAEGGVFVSADNGVHWTALNSGLRDLNANALLVDGSSMHAGTNTDGIYHSTDAGISWTAANTGLYATKVLCVRRYGEDVFAGASNGVFRSSDAGSSWVWAGGDLPAGISANALIVTDSLLFAGTGNSGVFRSSDRGVSWTGVNNGLGDLHTIFIAADRDTLYTGTQSGQHLYRSTDNGANWVATNLRSYANSRVSDAAVSGGYIFTGIYAGGTNGGVYRSSDGGLTWESVSNGIADPYINVLLAVDTLLYAGTQHSHVYRSSDHGNSWSDFSVGLAGSPVLSLVAHGGDLFAGTAHDGVLRSAQEGSGWTLINEGLSDDYIYSLDVSDSVIFAGTSHASVWKRPLTEIAQVTIPLGLNDGWNMVSVPVLPGSYVKTMMFPSAISDAFAYQAGYRTKDTLANGVGYWLKFAGAQILSITGFLSTRESVDVHVGWNLIGSIGSPLAVSCVESNPGGIITSQFFSYDSGYHPAVTIKPGEGYWVKVNQEGTLILSSSCTSNPAQKIRIVPTEEMPPLPPEGDVSRIQGALPGSFALAQNYPNPFNPSTTIGFSIPRVAFVTVKILNVLGEEVATLVSQQLAPGTYNARWNALGASSGVYFCRLQAGTFTEIKKLLLLR